MNKISCKEHPDSTLLDNFKDGDIICLKCGKVVSERNFGLEIKPEYPLNEVFNLYFKFIDEIKEVCARLYICEVVLNDAIYYFKKSVENCLNTRHHNDKAMAAIFIACKIHKVCTLREEIAICSGINENKIAHYAEEICTILGLNLDSIEPECYLQKFCYQLDLKFKDEKLARHILAAAGKMDILFFRKNQQVAAVALLISAIINGRNISKNEIKSICPMAESTIKNIYKKLLNNIKHLLPLELLHLIPNLPVTLK